MDYRCPLCAVAITKRKLSHAIVARMEMDCPHCAGRIRLNVHPWEVILSVFNFVAILGFAAGAYALQSKELALFAMGALMAGMAVLIALERFHLQDWPRFGPATPRTGP